MSAERDELARLAEEIPDEEVPSALAEVRKQLRRVRRARWPPAWVRHCLW
jgi:anti-sigma factor RsiW